MVGSDQLVDSTLFQVSTDCVIVLGLDGALKLINPSGVASFGVDGADQLIGKLWWSLWPTPGNGLAEHAFHLAVTGEVSTFDGAWSTAEGLEQWWTVTVRPVRNGVEEIEAVLVVSRDITELIKTKDVLRQTLRRKDEILATVAHELRNPLAAAVNAAQLLALRERAPADVSRIALIIARQLGHISRMAEDLVDSARIDRGQLSYIPSLVDLNTVVQIAVEQMHASANAKSQSLELQLYEGQCNVTGDETRLVQAVGNLIANAVRYTPRHGVIKVHVALDKGRVSVAVRDSGVGIASDRLGTLFDRYSRMQSNTTRESAGLGLGLSLVKAIVELHDGTVSASSAGVDRGSCFTIQLQSAVIPPEGKWWAIEYRTPEGERRTLKRQFNHTPSNAAVALEIRNALLPHPFPADVAEADPGHISLLLLEGLGYQITSIDVED